MATIKDVAKAANVSISTVSATFNESAVVREETRRRVWEAAAAVGYSPSAVARSLRLGRSRLIGVVVAGISNPFCATLIRTIEKQASAAGYSVITCNAEDESRSIEVLEQLRAQRVAGIVAMPVGRSQAFIDLLDNPGLPPLITVDQRVPGLARDFVGVDNRAAVRVLVEYLVRLGHRRIAFISGDEGLWTADERYDAAIQAVGDAGIDTDPSLFVRASYHARAGYQAAMDVLTGVGRPTAIIGGNNILALAALKAAFNLGFRCPDDISIAGIDDIPWAELVKPRITTVEQPVKDIVGLAVEWLLQRIDEPDADLQAREKSFPPSFIPGDSCARLWNEDAPADRS